MTTKRGLVFQAEIIEDDTLFFEDKFQTIPRCPRYKKKCVFTDPEGGAWTALLAPRLYQFNLKHDRLSWEEPGSPLALSGASSFLLCDWDRPEMQED